MKPTGPLPRPGWRALALDAVLALGLALFCFQAATDDPGPPLPIRYGPGEVPPLPPMEIPATADGSNIGAALLVFVLCAPLVLRRRYPLAVLWATMTTTLLLLARDEVQRPNLYVCVVLVCLVAVYSAAAHSPYRWPALLSLPLVAVFVAKFRDVAMPPVDAGYLPFLILAPLVAGAGGYHVWKRRTGEDRKLHDERERRQAEAVAAAAAGERARIARELHDVVTHHVSVMVIQAGAARSVLASAPGDARDALLAVEATGRSALTELRHVMGLLTPAADNSEPPAEPQPGLDEVPGLVQRMSAAGVPVELTVTGEPRPVPSGVGLAAYRVVQEALTNTMRHAGGAAATVTVVYAAEILRIEVDDTGGGGGPVESGGGHGLIGLRERLAVYGGSLQAGLRPGARGYRVEALIPLEAE